MFQKPILSPKKKRKIKERVIVWLFFIFMALWIYVAFVGAWCTPMRTSIEDYYKNQCIQKQNQYLKIDKIKNLILGKPE